LKIDAPFVRVQMAVNTLCDYEFDLPPMLIEQQTSDSKNITFWVTKLDIED
jgi:hypothetical protein